MSWLAGYKPSTSANSREEKREKLEAERQERLQKRAALKQQLQQAQQAQDEADQAYQELLQLAPDIFEDEELEMADFDTENGVDGKSALSDLKAVICPFMKDDIEFWFGQLEGQLEVIEIKSQWLKRIAIQRFLPPEIQTEVKSLLTLSKTAAGVDIYLRIKTELLELFGKKPEDGYTRAKNRVLTGKPSQLGKALINDLCKKDKKLDGCCCADIVWGMFRDALPIVVRNHIAELQFNKDTYKTIFTKADQVFDSNQASEPIQPRQVAATSLPASQQTGQEVAAVQRSGQNQSGKNKNNQNRGQFRGQNRGNQNTQGGQSSGGQSGQNGQNQNKPEGKPKKLINDDGHCRIHAKWKENATFCAAPWGCKMKNVYRSPQ